MADMNTTPLLTPQQVADFLNVSRRQVGRMVDTDPTFPRPIHLTPSTRRWDAAELEAFVLSRKRPAASAPLRVALPNRRRSNA